MNRNTRNIAMNFTLNECMIVVFEMEIILSDLYIKPNVKKKERIFL